MTNLLGDVCLHASALLYLPTTAPGYNDISNGDKWGRLIGDKWRRCKQVRLYCSKIVQASKCCSVADIRLTWSGSLDTRNQMHPHEGVGFLVRYLMMDLSFRRQHRDLHPLSCPGASCAHAYASAQSSMGMQTVFSLRRKLLTAADMEAAVGGAFLAPCAFLGFPSH